MAKNIKNICKLPLEACKFSSPVGHISVIACSQGLHVMELDGSLTDENFEPNEMEVVQLIEKKEKDLTTLMSTCYVWLQQYFKNVQKISQVPRPDICSFTQDNKGFRTQVWQMLTDTVGPGEVITYGELASRLNNPGAVRAVGSAMRNNPTGIIVPCHRVVRASDLGLYSGGKRQSVKLWLLRHEGVNKY